MYKVEYSPPRRGEGIKSKEKLVGRKSKGWRKGEGKEETGKKQKSGQKSVKKEEMREIEKRREKRGK